MQAKSVINCNPLTNSIEKAITLALSDSFKNSIKTMENPYGNGFVSKKILDELKKALDKIISLKKSFYDVNE